MQQKKSMSENAKQQNHFGIQHIIEIYKPFGNTLGKIKKSNNFRQDQKVLNLEVFAYFLNASAEYF